MLKLNLHFLLHVAMLLFDNNAIFTKLLKLVKDKNFPRKTVKYQKYLHRILKWMTNGLLRLIKVKDEQYKKNFTVDTDLSVALKTIRKLSDAVSEKPIIYITQIRL